MVLLAILWSSLDIHTPNQIPYFQVLEAVEYDFLYSKFASAIHTSVYRRVNDCVLAFALCLLDLRALGPLHEMGPALARVVNVVGVDHQNRVAVTYSALNLGEANLIFPGIVVPSALGGISDVLQFFHFNA